METSPLMCWPGAWPVLGGKPVITTSYGAIMHSPGGSIPQSDMAPWRYPVFKYCARTDEAGKSGSR